MNKLTVKISVALVINVSLSLKINLQSISQAFNIIVKELIQNMMTAKKVKMKTTVGCVAEFSQPMTHLITNKTVIFIVKNVIKLILD